MLSAASCSKVRYGHGAGEQAQVLVKGREFREVGPALVCHQLVPTSYRWPDMFLERVNLRVQRGDLLNHCLREFRASLVLGRQSTRASSTSLSSRLSRHNKPSTLHDNWRTVWQSSF